MKWKFYGCDSVKTIILKSNDKRTTETALSILKKGGIIIYPTETQYGMGADVINVKAIKKIFSAKARPPEKKVIWAFSDVKMIKKHFSLNRQQEKIVNKLMPGPFTLVINGQGFRIPANKAAIKIIRKFGRPITTTSANISGKETPNKIKDIIELFEGKVDMIIHAGDLKKSKPSTVFNWNTKEILRKGPISKKEIYSLLE